MLTRFRKIAYIMAYAVATIPLWHYIRDGRILALMVAVVTFAYIIVVLSTVEAAQPILSSEKAKIPLPRWLPNKPKYQKWWMLVRRTLKWHLLLIPPKMGLAVGFVEWLHITRNSYGHGMLNPYYYTSHNYNPILPIYPQWETIIFGALAIIMFALIELSFLSSIVVSGHAKLLNVIVKKLVITFILIGISSSFSTILWFDFPCKDCPWYYSAHFYRRLDDTVSIATNSVIEHGVLLAANIMRPVGEGSDFARAIEWDEYGFYRRTLEPDNRPFVARQVVAGMLGLLLYAGATWVVLWFVEDEVQRE